MEIAESFWPSDAVLFVGLLLVCSVVLTFCVLLAALNLIVTKIGARRERNRNEGAALRATCDALSEGTGFYTTCANVKVTEVKISLRHHEMLRAYVDIVLDNSLVIRDLRIIHSLRGYLVAMPSSERTGGKRVDIAHPITAEARRMIEDAVMAEYWKVVGESQTGIVKVSQETT